MQSDFLIALFVQMGSVLPKGGPGGLLIGFIIWSGIFWCINECFAEMVCYLPVPSPFVTFGAHWVDEAFGFAMSWNFFIKEGKEYIRVHFIFSLLDC